MTVLRRHSAKALSTTVSSSIVAIAIDLRRQLTYNSSGARHTVSHAMLHRTINEILPQVPSVYNVKCDFFKLVIQPQIM